ncbi:MAG: 5-formyltetrahydrofolate cyclo-ligase [Pricia sp.]
MLKKVLRSSYKRRRKAISSEYLTDGSLAIANAVLKLPIWQFDYFHLFLPISRQNEIDTRYILSMLQGRNKYVLIPKVMDDGGLKQYLLTDATKFRMNAWHIPEPVAGIEIATEKIDVVFVPLLAFDLKGNRVGYGKGFYDTFLRNCRKDVLKIGLSLFEAETSIDDIEPHDVPLNYCVTPNKTYSFSVRET